MKIKMNIYAYYMRQVIEYIFQKMYASKEIKEGRNKNCVGLRIPGKAWSSIVGEYQDSEEEGR